MKTIIDESEYDAIARLYLSGLSVEKIQDIYGVSNSVINRILRIKNIQKRDNSHKRRIYSVNENYFDYIDSSRKAYILGLLFSDGCNSRNRNSIKLELQERDKDILYLISEELESTNPIKLCNLNSINPNHQNTYRLMITNKHMSEALEKLGMIQNKSLNLQFPTYLLNDDLIASFICGYFDGDGHIEWRKSKFLTICGTSDFCKSLSDYLKRMYDIDCKIYNTANKDSITKVLHIFQKNQIFKFLDKIYNSTDFHIERKYNLYLKIREDMAA